MSSTNRVFGSQERTSGLFSHGCESEGVDISDGYLALGWGEEGLGIQDATWLDSLPTPVKVQSTPFFEAVARLGFRSALHEVNKEIARLAVEIESLPGGNLQVPISVLPVEGVDLQRPISLVVTQSGEDEFQASFYDANIHACGSTSGLAVQNVLEAIVYRFKHYSTFEPAKLGPRPRKQLLVLKRILRKVT